MKVMNIWGRVGEQSQCDHKLFTGRSPDFLGYKVNKLNKVSKLQMCGIIRVKVVSLIGRVESLN